MYFRDFLMTKEEIEGLEFMEKFEKDELGYMYLHSTKPQTVRIF